MFDDLVKAFWIFMAITAVSGWALIEGLIWIASHIQIGWT